jgi:hypothetical protein
MHLAIKPCTCLGTCRGHDGLGVGWYCVLQTGYIRCPNCESLMNQNGPCPECEHHSDGDCTCDHCLMSESEDEE